MQYVVKSQKVLVVLLLVAFIASLCMENRKLVSFMNLILMSKWSIPS